MKSVITAQSVANSVRMSRQLKPEATALVLEGSSDLRLYRNLVDARKCEFYLADGKAKVLEVIRLLKTSNMPGVLAIVDADTDHLDQRVSTNQDVITTETRDIEGLLVKSGALNKVLNEHGPPHLFPANFRELLLLAAIPLGYARWLAVRNGWSIDFKALSYTFIDAQQITCDPGRMCNEILQNNLGFGFTADELLKEIRLLSNGAHDKWHVARGHDLTAVLARVLSARSSRSCNRSDIEAQLRLAFDSESFTATGLYVAICDWQKRNGPFVLLKSQCADPEHTE